MLECGCPETFPDWHDQDIDLSSWCVHTQPIPLLFSMPMAYEMYQQRQQRTIEQLDLKERWPGLILSRSGLFRGAIIRLLEDTQSLSRQVKYLPVPFNVRAYLHKGNVSTLRPAVRDIQMSLLDSGKMPKELYLCHLTCPRCETQRGGEKILLLRRWTQSTRLKGKINQRNSK